MRMLLGGQSPNATSGNVLDFGSWYVLCHVSSDRRVTLLLFPEREYGETLEFV